MADNYLTVKQVADILKISDKTVYRMLSDGDIQHFNVKGQKRILQSDLNAYLESVKK